MKVALLTKKNRGEAVAVDLQLHWGDEKSLFGTSIVSEAANEMLMRGTSKYNREQLADAFSKLKMSGSPYHFDTTGPNLDAALRLAAHVLKDASFPEAEFEQMRQQWLVSLEGVRNEPQTLAQQAISQHYNHYPKGDVRYAMSIDEQVAAIKALKLEDVKAYHRNFYGASHGELSIVGDFDKAVASKAIADSYSGWESHMPYTRISSRHAPKEPLHATLNAPDKENGVYESRLDLDLSINDADYPALELANYIFGNGGLKSRLMDRIRQKDGLSYGGGSGLDAGEIDRTGGFGIQAIAAPQNLKKLEVAINEELQRALKDGFTPAEVAAAKSGMMQQRVQNRSKDDILAMGWSKNLFLERSYAWSKAFEAKLMALTPAQVTAAFRKAIDPGKMSVVVAGDQAKAAAKP